MNFKYGNLVGMLCLSFVAAQASAATSNVDVYGVLNFSLVDTGSTDPALLPWNPTVTSTFKPQLDALAQIGWSTLYGIVDADGVRADVTRNLITGEVNGTMLEEGSAYGDPFSGYLVVGSNPGAYLDTLVRNAESIAEASSTSFSRSQALTSFALTGAHHRPLMTTPFPQGDHCMWLTGDISHNSDVNQGQQLGEVGVCKDYMDGTVRIGAGLGASRATQDLAFGGELQFGGQHLLAEVDYRTSHGYLFSLTAIYGRGDTDVRRQYPSLLTPSIDSSLGSSETSSFGARIRLDLPDSLSFGKTSYTPYISYTQIRTRQAGYLETGGSAPAQYDALTLHTKEVMAGLTASVLASSKLNLRLSAEIIHLIDADNTPAITGQLYGFAPFSIPTAAADANFARVGFDLDYFVSNNSIVALTAHVSGNQPGPTWSGSLSWRMGF